METSANVTPKVTKVVFGGISLSPARNWTILISEIVTKSNQAIQLNENMYLLKVKLIVVQNFDFNTYLASNTRPRIKVGNTWDIVEK